MSTFKAPDSRFGSPAHPVAQVVPAPGPICKVDCPQALDTPDKDRPDKHSNKIPSRNPCFIRILFTPIDDIALQSRMIISTRARLRNRPKGKGAKVSGQKYFPAILNHSGQSCFELSFQTSSQCGIALLFRIAENFTFASRQISQSADPSTIFICR